MNNKYQIAFVSTYPPRECGIATFTQDLVNELDKMNILKPQKIIAINDTTYNYEPKVVYEIEQQNKQSYLDTAEKINNSNIDLVCIELEYGIFGGESGEYIIDFANKLNIPIVTTLHTILPTPSEKQKFVLSELGKKSEKIITMAKNSIDILYNIYDIPKNKIYAIPHGVPFAPLSSRNELKKEFGYEGKKIISTFGLISPGKGIENAIEAVSKIKDEFPNTLYLILGQTHPAIKKQYGETYRNSLKQLAKTLNIEDKVIFVDKYFEKNELLKYLKLSDIYMTPYLNKDQAVSGTLAYAIGYGKAIISTKYKYAEEILGNNRGILVDFEKPSALADGLRKILSDENYQESLEKKALEYSSNMMWPTVASSYTKLFSETINNKKENQNYEYKPFIHNDRQYRDYPTL